MTTLSAPRPKSLLFPWILLGVLWAVSFINQADRAVLVSVLPAIRDEFHLSNLQLAFLNSAFLWTYAAAAVVAGWLGDHRSRARVILSGLILWSLATIAAPFSPGFAALAAVRGLTAAFEALYYPSGTALITDWQAERHRSFALSLHQTAAYAGPAVGALLAGVLADRIGWRAPFLIYGAVGLLISGVVALCVRDAPSTAKGAGSAKADWRGLLTNRAFLVVCAAFFFATGATQAVIAWAPTFAHDTLRLNLKDSALYTSLPIYVTGFLIVPISGGVGDRLRLRMAAGRTVVLAAGALIAGLFLATLPLARTPAHVAVVLGGCYLGKGLFDGCIYAVVQEIVGPRQKSSAVGVLTAVGFLGAGADPILVSLLAQRFGMSVGLAALSAFYILACLLCAGLIFGRFSPIASTPPSGPR